MNNSNSLNNVKQISIIGLGKSGQLISKLLSSVPNRTYRIIGYDSDTKIYNEMKNQKIVDSSEWNLDKAVEQSDVIFLCVPKIGLVELFEDLNRYIKTNCVIIDTSIFKKQVIESADSIFGNNVSFIGGSVIVKRRIEDNYFVLIPSKKADSKSMRTVISLVKLLGFSPLFLDIDEHDNLMFALYGLPSLLSTAYRNMMMGSPSWREIEKLSGSNFLKLSEISLRETEDEKYMDYIREQIPSEWLDRFNKSLSYLTDSNGFTNVDKINVIEDFRDKFFKLKEGLNPNIGPDKQVTKFDNGMISLLLGSKLSGLLSKKNKKTTSNLKKKKKE